MARVGRRWRVPVVVCVASLVVILVGSVPPAGASTVWWTPVEPLGELDDLALTADGRVMAFGTVTTTGGAVVIATRVQDPSGAWGPEVVLSEPEELAGVVVKSATNGTDTYLLWTGRHRTEVGGDLVGVARLRGDTWDRLPGQNLGQGSSGDVAMGADGTIVAARSVDGPGSDIVAVRFDGSTWTEPETVMTGWWAYSGLVVAVAGDGTPLVTALALVSSNWEILASAHGDGGWSTPAQLTTGGAGPLAAVTSSSGEVVVAYPSSGELASPEVRALTYDDGAWIGPTVVASAPGLHRPVLVATPDGAVELALADVDAGPQVDPNVPDGTMRVLSARHTSGAWSPATEEFRLPYGRGTGRALDLSIGVDGSRAVVVTAPQLYGPDALIVLRPRNGGWLEPFSLEMGNSAPAVVVDEGGFVHAGAVQHGTMSYRFLLVMPFSDVAPYDFFAGAVVWAADNGLTTGVGGTDEFQPFRPITRAEAITVLWRYAGQPSAPPAGFADVAPGSYFSAAVDWARDEGLTTGVAGQNLFQPHRTITRAELVTLLWRLAGMPSAPSLPFDDAVPGAYYTRALDWARSSGITTGVGGTNRFEPGRDVTRAEAFTFVFRFERSTGGLATASAERPLVGARPLEASAGGGT